MPPPERTTRFTCVLGVAYVAIGAVMTVPVTMHAVTLEMPQTGAMPQDIVGPLVLAIGMLALIVIVPLAVTRALAAICARGANRET